VTADVTVDLGPARAVLDRDRSARAVSPLSRRTGIQCLWHCGL